MKILLRFAALAALSLVWAIGAQAAEIHPMFGAWMIDGYDMGAKPIGPKGSYSYHADTNVIKGKYTGLSMPKGRKAIFAWLHDTVNQKTLYVGAVGWLKNNAGGADKGQFTIQLPSQFQGGDFGTYEIIGFSSEPTNFLNGTTVVTQPGQPSGSQINPAQTTAFYLFGALPNADTTLIYCGHGQDFSYAKAPEKQTCFD